MFYEKLQQICRKKGTTPTALLKKLGISTSKVTAWKKGSVPKADLLKTIADALETPVSYFYGESQQGNENISPAKQQLIDQLSGMTEEELQKVNEIVDFVLSKREK